MTCSLWKYADDFTLLARLKGKGVGEDIYRESIDKILLWSVKNNLKINIMKTKEMIFDFRRKLTMNKDPITINNLDVEIVSSHKLLGTYFQQSCKWDINSFYLIKKARNRLYCLNVLKSYGVDTKILITTYKSIIESILANSIMIWYSGLTSILREKLNRVVKIASKIIGTKLLPLDELYQDRLHKKFQKIRSDKMHPANNYFTALRRRVRLLGF